MRLHRPRPARRLHPCHILAELLDRPEEDRLSEYRVRWRVVAFAVEQRRAELGRLADALAEAERRWLRLGPGRLTADGRAARSVELVERAVLGFWRDRPSPRPRDAGRRLPPLTGGAYFVATGTRRLHWLDLHASLVREALQHVLPALVRRASPGRLAASGLALLLADVTDEIRACPDRAVAGRRLPRLLARLARLAVRAHAPATRDLAAGGLDTLLRLLRGDARARREHRRHHLSGSRRRYLARHWALMTLLAEAQRKFRKYCAGLAPSALPPPLVERTSPRCAPSARPPEPQSL